jgi:SOS-response transcriptional repressor LexA
MTNNIRPTKKQQETLIFISEFIAQHGYSPSYREIMVGCNYNSVATVALHVSSLIKRGHLVKRGRSARSLEVVEGQIITPAIVGANVITASEEKWLVKFIDNKFKIAEDKSDLIQKDIDELYVLVGALKVMELNSAANSFIPRLTELVNKLSTKPQ